MRVKLLTLTSSALLALALLAQPGVASADPDDRRSTDRAADTTAERVADRALAEARSLFDDHAARPDRDATMVLRDLVRSLDDLSARERAAAERILARPTDGASDPQVHGYTVPEETPDCTGDVCLHWVAGTADATDPAWVPQTGAVIAEVWAKIVGDLGYRTPMADDAVLAHGPDPKLDVYLADLGGEGMYGYCVPEPLSDTVYYSSGYCVLDNDFHPDQYGGTPALTSLQVTAAHEFFHAVQFGYDYAEDAWLMEGSAAWVEEQVYDDANDNHQYLPISALSVPWLPLDFTSDEIPPYGAWVFWQFLAEYFGTTTEADPSVVREVWERADATAAAPDEYSAQAVRSVVMARGTTFTKAFQAFGVVNRIPGRWYFEGASYPAAPLTGTFTLTGSRPGSGSRATSLDHLTTDYFRFKPGSTLKGSRKLKVTLDMPNTSRGSAAALMVYKKGGGVALKVVGLTADGDATVKVPFSRSEVSAVDLVLTNASIRFECWQVWGLSCGGVPLDDNLRTAFSAKAVRG